MDHLNFQEEVTFLLFGVLFFSYWWDEQFGLVLNVNQLKPNVYDFEEHRILLH